MIPTVLCPRCELQRYTPLRTDWPEEMTFDQKRAHLAMAPYPAKSRVADVYICSACGTDEALRDLPAGIGASPLGLSDWPVTKPGSPWPA